MLQEQHRIMAPQRVLQQALGTHTRRTQVQGARLKTRREIRVATLFREAPAALLRDEFKLEAGRDYTPVFSGKHDNSVIGVANKDYPAAERAMGNICWIP